MHKYVKLSGIIIMCVVVYTVFFMTNKNISESFPQLTIHDKSGDRSYIQPLVLDGNIFVNEYLLDEFFRLEDTGITYETELSFIDRLDGSVSTNRYNELKKEYRSFMRGKENFDDFYDETDEAVAYVTTPISSFDYEPSTFEVSVLDKETKAVTKVTIDIPDRQEYWYVDIRDIHYEDGIVYVTTVNSKEAAQETDIEDVYVHMFDMDKEQYVKSEKVTEVKSTESIDHYVFADVWKDENERGKLYVVESSVTYGESEFEDDETEMKNIISLDVVTQETEALQDNIKQKITTDMALQAYGGKMYFIEEEKGQVNIVSYDVESGEVEKNLLVEREDKSYDDFAAEYIVQVNDNHMYIVPSYIYDETPNIYVYDLQKLETVYVGELVIENGAFKQLETEIHFNDVYFESTM